MVGRRIFHDLIAVTALAGVLTLAPAASVCADVGISVTPTRLATTISPGDETRETITLSNTSDSEMEVDVSVDSAPTGPGAAAVTVTPGQVTLAKDETATVEVKIAVPADTEPGQQDASVVLSASGKENGNVAIVGQVRVTLAIQVYRPLSDVGFSYPRLVDSSDSVVIAIDGTNNGNFPVSLDGQVVLKGLLSEEILHGKSDVLRVGDAGHLELSWEDKPLIGIRRMTINLGTGAGAPVKETAFILIFPWKIFLGASLVLLIGVVAVRLHPRFTNVLQAKWRKKG